MTLCGQKALRQLEKLLDELNTVLREKKNLEHLLRIQASFVVISKSTKRKETTIGRYLNHLANNDRKFLREGDLSKVGHTQSRRFRFWLFTDCLLYGYAMGENFLALENVHALVRPLSLARPLSLLPLACFTVTPSHACLLASQTLTHHVLLTHGAYIAYGAYGAYTGGECYSFHNAFDLRSTRVQAHTGPAFQHAFEVLTPETSFVVVAASKGSQVISPSPLHAHTRICLQRKDID